MTDDSLDDTQPSLDASLKAIADKIAAKKRKHARIEKTTTVLKLVAVILMIPLAMYWQGYVLARLWEMFAAPTFGFHVTTYIGFGLMLLFRFLMPQNLATKDAKNGPFAQAITTGFLAPLVALWIGHIWQWLHWGA